MVVSGRFLHPGKQFGLWYREVCGGFLVRGGGVWGAVVEGYLEGEGEVKCRLWREVSVVGWLFR